jgi:hypothetical protein
MENLHPFARRALDIKCDKPLHTNWCATILEGIATRKGEKWYMERSDAPYRDMLNLQDKFPVSWFTIDWSWVDTYLVVTEWIERTRKMWPEWK